MQSLEAVFAVPDPPHGIGSISNNDSYIYHYFCVYVIVHA